MRSGKKPETQGKPRHRSFTHSARAVENAEGRQARKQTLAAAYWQLTELTVKSLLAAAPSFKSESNLRAQLDTRRANSPNIEQLREVAALVQEQMAKLAGVLASIDQDIQHAEDVEGILAHVQEIATGATSAEDSTLDSGDVDGKTAPREAA